MKQKISSFKKRLDRAWQCLKGAEPQSYAQTGEDKIVLMLLGVLGIQSGRYLDIGANDPFRHSNTALLYLNGHSGIVVDPEAGLKQAFARSRPRDRFLACAVTPNACKTLKIFCMQESTLTTSDEREARRLMDSGQKLRETLEMPAITIPEILAQYCQNQWPDFLDLDIEGSDEEVLYNSGIGPSTGPGILCLETLKFIPGSKGQKRIEYIQNVEKMGYIPVADTWINTIFVRQDLWERRS